MRSFFEIPNNGLLTFPVILGIDFNPRTLVPLSKLIKNVSTLSERVCPIKSISFSLSSLYKISYLASLIFVSEEFSSRLESKFLCLIFKLLAILLATSSKSFECFWLCFTKTDRKLWCCLATTLAKTALSTPPLKAIT